AFGLLAGAVGWNVGSTLNHHRAMVLAAAPEILDVSKASAKLNIERQRWRKSHAELSAEVEEAEAERARLWNESLASAGETSIRWSAARA
ncbi:hypothetical protein RCL01_25130, partial [Salmonella enterica subsp. enterica serovar 1,4,[5],12:i:-]